MKVYRRKMPNGNLSPTFYVSYQIDGRRIIKSTGCATRRDAEKVARDLVDPLRKQRSAKAIVEEHRRLLTGATDITIADAWELVAASLTCGEKQAANHASRWGDFAAYMAATFPAVSMLAQVTEDHVRGYMARIRTKGRFNAGQTYKRGRKTVTVKGGRRKLSPRTVNAFFDTLRMVFDALALRAGLAGNPMAGVDRASNTYATREAFTLEEIRALAEAAEPFVRDLLAVVVNTGLRLRDACNLRWRDVDFAAGEIRVTMTKTGREVTVPLFSEGFRGWLEARRRDAPEGEYVLPEQQQMREANPDGLSYRFKRLCEGVLGEDKPTTKVDGRTRRVSRYDWHSCRHAFLTLAGAAGVPPHLLRRLAGHQSAEMTGRYVDHEDTALVRGKLAGMEIIPLGNPDPLPAPEDDLRRRVRDLVDTADRATLEAMMEAAR